jgi:hypothetical protein
MRRRTQRAARQIQRRSSDKPGRGCFRQQRELDRCRHAACLEMTSEIDLNVKLVSYGAPSEAFLQMAEDFD